MHYGRRRAAGMPRPIVDKLNAVLREALLDDTRRPPLCPTEGAEVLASTPEEYAADIAAEEAKWSPIVRKAGVKAE